MQSTSFKPNPASIVLVLQFDFDRDGQHGAIAVNYKKAKSALMKCIFNDGAISAGRILHNAYCIHCILHA